MALTINNSPTDYNFSRNAQYVEIETDNYTYTANFGTKSVVYFNGLANAVVNNTLTIQWNTVSLYVFTFKSTTTIGSNELAVKASGQADFDYVIQLANDLMSHPGMASLFDVTGLQASLYITAKTAGSAINFTSSATSVSGAQIYRTQGQDNIQTQARPNYAIRLELYGWNGSAWELLVNRKKTPAANKVRFDLGPVTDDYLRYDYPAIFPGSAIPFVPFKCSNVIRKFYVAISEEFGNPPTTQSTTVSPTGYISSVASNKHLTYPYWILKAGFDASSEKVKPDQQLTYYFSNYAFLTRQPRQKKIYEKQLEWLYYCFNLAYTNVCLRYRFFDANGTETVYYSAPTIPGINAAQMDVWGFPVNGPNIGFANRAYVKMIVCLYSLDSAAAISENFTYLLKQEQSVETTYLYFANSDGGLDTLLCTGQITEGADLTRDVADRTKTIKDTYFDGHQLQLSAEKQNKNRVFSGWKTQAEMDYMEELFMSNYVFVYGNRYGQDIQAPVIITNKEIVTHQTNQNLRGYVIDYVEAIKSPVSQARYYPI